ncbi:SusC/RagA family TonB-linked outer membrane protein [Pedobacter endophyticus]|uniref:SusC/RagA family TonB-linked outer membrane protein n=1 Tax=Pedobacter endophyticus TaxID=2789740 RepID=A0A7U3Q5K0_9SPHI|nr:SusC/RagA family TonB-linked outer membrane protein [Pedobacter endophyticus]QPH38882.1 SusC/RagA family TonB-linked outer membrane protein [Pedobacter endophyticus]
MAKIITRISCALLLCIFGFPNVQAKTYVKVVRSSFFNASPFQSKDPLADTTKKRKATVVRDTMPKNITMGKTTALSSLFKNTKDSLRTRYSRQVPNLSLQQMLKGNVAGLYVQETTGEPGTEQSMIIQGTSAPIFSKRDIYEVQPAVYLNGVHLIQENPFAYDVQKYDYNRIGPATNLLANVDIDNIEAIEVIKDPVSLAKLGPNAANGAIWITTKSARSGAMKISVNSYFGVVPSENVQTVNGVFENNFRAPFYRKYATLANYDSYASFLRDSTNVDYFGSSNWNDLYYKNAGIYGVNMGITGGSERANFRFYGTAEKSASNADATSLDKYNAYFAINMKPFDWMTVSSFLNAARMDRDRNKSLRDRFAEVRYLPDFTNPLSPSADNYRTFLDEYKKAVDDNRSNLLNGSLAINAEIMPKLHFNTALVFDYNEGIRDAFFPTTLMDGVNFVSNYFGFNQRFGINNTLSYSYRLNKSHSFDFILGQSVQNDISKYNYARGYEGRSDFIKLNVVNGNAGSSNYLNAIDNFYVFRYTDKMENGLMSFYASAKYRYKNLLNFGAVLRRDGSSRGQPDSRWVTTPAFSAEWSLKNQFLTQNTFFNDLKVGASWGRSAKIYTDDRFAAGPQYRTEYGWPEEPTIPSSNGVGISRPYNTGWVGYGITLPYSDRLNISASSTVLKNRLTAAITFYNRDDKNQLINIPLSSESGYTSIFKNGMAINNKGIDLLLSAGIIQHKAFNWRTSVNFNYNKNELRALPDGLNELVIGDNKLQVGQPVGAYWLYINNGIYNSDAEVPTNSANGQKLTFNGQPLKAGDPKWLDTNGDYDVNSADKQFIGNRAPNFIGGWINDFSYQNFDLNFNVFFALGQKSINQFDVARYDFANRESRNDINSIKEITSWQTTDNLKTYPIYNAWSNVIPYRADQDLFLESTSYVKLRSVTLGYDFSKANILGKGKKGFKRAYVYLTGSNLLTLSSFSGTDPELVNYTGIYTGTSLPIARTYILGLKLDL